ncbi:non-ribosomal peptide synthetase [Stackebrandtia nassauensis]|uniref:Amino acid adenylation domain protein n=1 Tax=Stackebrandtia nassauensis (strain DSM 44728 / CIP 108903 / NRRL B-16338 / NBRC 102104 / LLR-40K-21) TaxID=446470 RepID=D3Q1R2_STANL|nr:non-ribosomal peptide synthetase [Stackebrandtia nassauensis]ADD39910.1 amino acid adenylation domain protein [Stackebrandtia nassauensis DSM 44728]
MNEVYPVSFAQRRLWFAEQLTPGGARQHVDLTRRVHGTVDVAALQSAVDTVVARHESLRTRFGVVDGSPVQVIVSTVAVPVEVIETGDAPAALREVIERPFRLDEAPLLRVALIRGGGDTVLTFVLHHIIADGWSLGVLADEIGSCYLAYLGGTKPHLPPLRLQYVDYTLWQAEAVKSEAVAARHRDYVAALSGAPQLLELPGDRLRPDEPRHEGATTEFTIPDETMAAVERLATRCGSTVYMTLLSAYFLVLSRWTGQRDLLVATPSAGRGRSETEALIGFFVNTVVLRGDVSGDPTVAELVARTRDASLAAFANEDVPFEWLVEGLAPERSLIHHPLVQAMFSYQNTPGDELKLPGARLERLDVYGGTSMFDMTLELAPGASGLDGVVQYSTALFDPETAHRFAVHFGNAVAAMVDAPDRPVSGIEILAAEEREHLLRTGTGAPSGDLTPALTRIRDRAASEPDRVAVIDTDGEVSYEWLCRHADTVAAALRELGLEPESLVAVCLPRNRFMLSTLLGVWAADAAFVPLDPGYPAARLEFMLADSGAVAVLSTRELAASLPIAEGTPVIHVDELPDNPTLEPSAVEVPADRLAYTIYTSGSTGRPKGVQIEHRGIANQIDAFADLLGFTAEDRMAGLTSMSFDPVFIELFVPLVTGGTVVMLDNTMAGDPERLDEALTEHGVTVAQATPSTWKLYTDHAKDAPPRLRRILTGGEALSSDLAESLLWLGLEVHNVYGPTETTVWATSAHITDPGRITVGRPIPGLRMFIMDSHGRLAPTGAAGELWIAGTGVARSYQGRADLSAERFVTAPDGTRAFRTGDLARWNRDGSLDFLGRVDDQVKIRGHRIELGEIEAVLREHPDVRDALVAVRTAPGGEKQLVAAVTGSAAGAAVAPGGQPGREPTSTDWLASEAKRWAARQLPAHMVPSQITAVAALPLTPSGKGDRKAVAALAAPPDTAPDRALPADDAQLRLHEVWCEVLQLPAVSVTANLFDLGATSMSIVKVRQELRVRHGLDLPLTAFFTHPTIAALAASLGVEPRPAVGAKRGAARRRVPHPDAARRRERRRGRT